jgi:hypothetical protein
MKTYGGVDKQTRALFTSALVEGECSDLRPPPPQFTSREIVSVTYWLGDCVNPRAGPDDI